MIPTHIIYIIVGIVALLLIGGIISMFAYTMPIAKWVYEDQLVKTSPDKWLRECSAPENEEQIAMWNAGCAWAEERKDKMTEVMIENDGLKLYGEFYNFGGDRCVIVLPGRCECLKYSYYFASPYEKAGVNVLVIDQRAHGLSEGDRSTIGVKEHRDVIQWIHFIEKEFGIKEVWFHGICVGSASAIQAMVSPDCPSSVKGMVSEGGFITFRETFKQHMKERNKPTFPVLDEVMFLIWKKTGTNVFTTSPKKLMPKVKQRVLFLYGEQDKFSRPDKSKKLYESCGSSDKKLVWFDKGLHSHLRINNVEKYDQAIIDFVNQ